LLQVTCDPHQKGAFGIRRAFQTWHTSRQTLSRIKPIQDLAMIHYRSLRIDGSTFFRFPRNRGSVPVRPNPRAGTFESSVSVVLSLIERRSTGRIVLDFIDAAIRNTRHTLSIVPTTTSTNAGAEAQQGEAAFPAGATVRVGDDGHVARRRNGQPRIGRGGGSDVRLLFNPQHLNPSRSAFRTPNATPDDVLLHELVHAIRQMNSRLTNAPTGTLFGNEDEFLSIVIADIYQSEGGATLLSASHNGTLPRSVPSRGPETRGAIGGLAASRIGTLFDLPDFLRDSAPRLDDRFEAHHWDIFSDLFRQEPELFRAIAAVRSHFNPIRKHLIHSCVITRPAAVSTAPLPTARPPQTAAEALGDPSLPAAMRRSLEPAPSGPLRF
jgi:hypothetical protein